MIGTLLYIYIDVYKQRLKRRSATDDATPLVMSTSGGMGREAQAFYKRLADKLAQKKEMQYRILMGWLRCKLSFAILRSAVIYIRGSRSSKNHPIKLRPRGHKPEGNVPQASSGEE